MEYFARPDVEAIAALLGHAGDPTIEATVADRKRYVLEATAKLVGAEMWLWNIASVNAATPGDTAIISLIDGGWESEQQRAWLFGFTTNPELSGQANRRGHEAHHAQSPRTLLQREMYDHEQEVAPLMEQWRANGLGDMLLSVYPISPELSSVVALYRRAGHSNFTERDRAIVHLIFQQVDWLHRDGLNIPAGPTVIQLSPRERQVLVFLMSGDAQKEIAIKLGLSSHTVNDYMKSIYRQLNVSSRAELMALFISGGAQPGSNASTN